MGRYISVNNLPTSTTVEVTTAYTATVYDRILADSTGAAFTITLPATPLDGDTVQIIDVASQFGTNNVTVARNGELINGVADDLVLDVVGSVVSLVYTGATYGWVISGL